MKSLMSGIAILVAVALLTGCESMPGRIGGPDDAWISSSVKGKLAEEKTANLSQIGVDTQQGTVYLSGVVPSFEHKVRAEQIARDVRGVTQVVNRLQIQPVSLAEDPAVTSSVKARFMEDRTGNLSQIAVDTQKGTVYLSGTVPSFEHKMHAEQLARDVRGVTQVVNNLQVQPSIDDPSITASVKGKLMGDRFANLARINVDTSGGIVYLNGVVPSNDHKLRAEQLAREVRGVSQVVNNLQVQP
jgi:hyperosmotically inducible protein